MKAETKPFLLEIGCEEMPASVQKKAAEDIALEIANEFIRNFQGHLVGSFDFRSDNTPRRLLIVADFPDTLEFEVRFSGPPIRVVSENAKALKGFVEKAKEMFPFAFKDHGVDCSSLDSILNAKLEGLNFDGCGKIRKPKFAIDKEKIFYTCEKILSVQAMLAELIPNILRTLSLPKRMKWNHQHELDTFIRPIRWIVARLGDEVIPFAYAGVESGKISHGHRVHGASGEIDVRDPFAWLEGQHVLADRDARRTRIATQLARAADDAGVRAIEDEALLDEVTDLVEWPVVVTGRFDARYLALPEEVIRIELKHHQRCFASRHADGSASHVFFAVANIESAQPELVARGNERVVNARLADAMFYFERDPKESLESRVEKLSQVVFQDGLGMVGDQVRRLRGFVLDNAAGLGVDANDAQRAAYLCKSDLTTGLVYEFPELQGYMGGIYARMDGENEAVAQGIAGHYRPESATDPLPESPIARAIGIAERADKLLGYFHLGRVPTASADPFGLRRAAIGLIRLLAADDHPVGMTLDEVLAEAAKQWNQQRVTIAVTGETQAAVRDFVHERLLGMAGPLGVTRAALDGALHAAEARPLHQTLRIARLLTDFAGSDTGQAVAAANKRIANILKKAAEAPGEVDEALLAEDAEQALYRALAAAESGFPDDPEARLSTLAGLREPVDRFFDEVMVMCEDEARRRNRLALLARLRRLFLRVADFSRLSLA